jgi:type II secretory pathway component PulJ
LIVRFLERRERGDRGSTVLEVALASALFMLMVGAVLTALDSGTRSERVSQARQEALLDLRQAMTQMTKEIRQAVSIDPTSTATRLDMHTLVGGTDRRVVYEVSGSAPNAILRRTVYTPTATTFELANRIVAPQAFCYQFNETCLATTPGETLSSIRVSLALTPVVLSAGSITLATDIELRNL